MQVSALSVTDREILLQAFQRFRAADEFEPDNTATRDTLALKLQEGAGQLDEVDREMLGVAIATVTGDDDLLNHFQVLLEL